MSGCGSLTEQCCVTVVDGVCTVAGCVGRELAPHVKKHGGKLIPESMRTDKNGRSNIDGAMVVAASGVQGGVHLPFFILIGRLEERFRATSCTQLTFF